MAKRGKKAAAVVAKKFAVKANKKVGSAKNVKALTRVKKAAAKSKLKMAVTQQSSGKSPSRGRPRTDKTPPAASTVGRPKTDKTPPAASTVGRPRTDKTPPAASTVGRPRTDKTPPAASAVGRPKTDKTPPAASAVGRPKTDKTPPAASAVGRPKTDKTAPAASAVGRPKTDKTPPAASAVSSRAGRSASRGATNVASPTPPAVKKTPKKTSDKTVAVSLCVLLPEPVVAGRGRSVSRPTKSTPKQSPSPAKVSVGRSPAGGTKRNAPDPVSDSAKIMTSPSVRRGWGRRPAPAPEETATKAPLSAVVSPKRGRPSKTPEKNEVVKSLTETDKVLEVKSQQSPKKSVEQKPDEEREAVSVSSRGRGRRPKKEYSPEPSLPSDKGRRSATPKTPASPLKRGSAKKENAAAGTPSSAASPGRKRKRKYDEDQTDAKKSKSEEVEEEQPEAAEDMETTDLEEKPVQKVVQLTKAQQDQLQQSSSQLQIIQQDGVQRTVLISPTIQVSPPRAAAPGVSSPRATVPGSVPLRATVPGSGPHRATVPGSIPLRATVPGSGPLRATVPGSGPPRSTAPGAFPPRATTIPRAFPPRVQLLTTTLATGATQIRVLSPAKGSSPGKPETKSGVTVLQVPKDRQSVDEKIVHIVPAETKMVTAQTGAQFKVVPATKPGSPKLQTASPSFTTTHQIIVKSPPTQANVVSLQPTQTASSSGPVPVPKLVMVSGPAAAKATSPATTAQQIKIVQTRPAVAGQQIKILQVTSPSSPVKIVHTSPLATAGVMKTVAVALTTPSVVSQLPVKVHAQTPVSPLKILTQSPIKTTQSPVRMTLCGSPIVGSTSVIQATAGAAKPLSQSPTKPAILQHKTTPSILKTSVGGTSVAAVVIQKSSPPAAATSTKPVTLSTTVLKPAPTASQYLIQSGLQAAGSQLAAPVRTLPAMKTAAAVESAPSEVKHSESEQSVTGEAAGPTDPLPVTTSCSPPSNNCKPSSNGEELTAGGDDVVEPDLSEYVIIDMADVPAAESAVVNAAAPPVAAGNKSESNHEVSHCSDFLTNRQYVKNPKIVDSTISKDHTFSIASYNILADFHMKKVGTDVYPNLARQELQQDFRHELLMKELRFLDSDLICLQECGVDYYSKTLEPALKALGYSGQFKKRLHDTHPEGEATFYRLSRFTLVMTAAIALKDLSDQTISQCSLDDATKASIRQYLNSSEIILITKLRCNHTMKELTVGNVHIQWTQYKKLDLQCIQVACAVKELVNVAGGSSNAYILAGDFNSLPSMAPYQLARDGYLNDEMIDKLQQVKNVVMPDGSSQSLVNLWWHGFNHTSPNLNSVYATVKGSEPEATTVNVCGPTSNECVDYILCSPEVITVLGVLECHTESELQKIIPLPNHVFPSDHTSIKANLAFK